jgi:hypothetical protein
MVCISLQLAEKPSAAGVLNDQEGGSAGSAHGQGEHSARALKLQNDAVGFRAHGVVEKGWRSSVIAWSAAIHRATVADAQDQRREAAECIHQESLPPAAGS